MAHIWTEAVQTNSLAKRGCRIVLLELALRANEQGICWPSLKSISERTRLCERAVRYALRSLEKIGEIRVSTRGGRSSGGKGMANVYMLTVSTQKKGASNDQRRGQVCAPQLSLEPSTSSSYTQTPLRIVPSPAQEPTTTPAARAAGGKQIQLSKNDFVDSWVDRIESRLRSPDARTKWHNRIAALGHKIYAMPDNRIVANEIIGRLKPGKNLGEWMREAYTMLATNQPRVAATA